VYTHVQQQTTSAEKCNKGGSPPDKNTNSPLQLVALRERERERKERERKTESSGKREHHMKDGPRCGYAIFLYYTTCSCCLLIVTRLHCSSSLSPSTILSFSLFLCFDFSGRAFPIKR